MLLRQTLSFLPAQLLGPLAQFVAVVAWTHWLPPATYGLIALIMAAQELVFQISLSWWTHYTIRYLSGLSETERRARYQAVENAVQLASIPLQILLVFGLLAWNDHASDPALLAATIAYAVSRSLTMQLAEHARARAEVWSYTIAQTTGPLVGFLIGWVFIAMLAPSATLVLAGFAIAQILAVPFLAKRLALGWQLRFDIDTIRKAASFGLPMLLTGVIGWVSINGIRVIVDHQEGAAAVGLVSIGWGLGQRLSSVVSMLVISASFPLAIRRLAQAGPAGALRQMSENGTLLASIIVPATAGVFWLSQPLVETLVGPEFWDATLVILPIAVLAAAIRNLRAHWADQVFYLFAEPKILILVNIGEAIGVVVLCWFGLRWGGLAGACMGCLVASGTAALVCFALAIRRHGLVIQIGPLAKIVAGTALMVLLIRADWFPPGALGLALRIVGGAAVYFAAIGILFREHLPPLRLRRA